MFGKYFTYQKYSIEYLGEMFPNLIRYIILYMKCLTNTLNNIEGEVYIILHYRNSTTKTLRLIDVPKSILNVCQISIIICIQNIVDFDRKDEVMWCNVLFF